MASHEALLEDILALVPLVCPCSERRCDNKAFQFQAAGRQRRLRAGPFSSFLALCYCAPANCSTQMRGRPYEIKVPDWELRAHP